MLTNVQQTSIDSFRSLQNLGARQKAILDIIASKKNGITNLEISHISHIPINQVTPRTNELVKMGLVTKHQNRKCMVSGRTAICWKVVV